MSFLSSLFGPQPDSAEAYIRRVDAHTVRENERAESCWCLSVP